MDTALKMMSALRKTRDQQLTTLQDAGPGHRDRLKAAGTFRNDRLPRIEIRYETTSEFRHLGEGVRLAALIDYDKRRSLRDRDFVGLEVPTQVWSSSSCLCKQVRKLRGECRKR